MGVDCNDNDVTSEGRQLIFHDNSHSDYPTNGLISIGRQPVHVLLYFPHISKKIYRYFFSLDCVQCVGT